MPNRTTTDGNYRYAFQGQEKDGETGMEAFELRLWDGRIGRWSTIDPEGQYFSPYLGMGNNPVSRIDPNGGSDGGADGYGGPPKSWLGRLFDNVFGSKTANSTPIALNEVVVKGKSLPKERIAEPRSSTWHAISGFLFGSNTVDLGKRGNFVVNANGYATANVPRLIAGEAPGAFFLGAGEIKFATYSSEVINTLVSTEQIAGQAAQNAKAIADIAKKMNSKNVFDAVESIDVFIHNGKRYIIDGHHRVEAAKLINTTIEVTEYYGKEAYKRFPGKVQQILDGMF
jgi:RHS repeat-associated protein